MKLRLPKLAALAVLSIALVTLATACDLVSSDDDGGNSGARVPILIFCDTPADRPCQVTTPLRNYFAPNSAQIQANVLVQNATAGLKLTGRWYQLGTPDAGSAGQEVNSSDVTINGDQINDKAETQVQFFLRSGTSGSGFPEDSWLLRIYEGDTLLKTSSFIVTRAAQATAPTGTTGATGTGGTAQPQNYTVVAGDTLQTVAQRFLPQGEQAQNFINRIATLNNIQATATLQPGQVLRIPGPQ